MPEVFTSFEAILVDAPEMGDGYKYRVARGIERWPEVDESGKEVTRKVAVCKVQLVNPDGKVLGRQAPSYPSERAWKAVREAVDSLMARLPETKEVRAMTVRELIEQAAQALQGTHSRGFTEDDLCAYLNENQPRQDGRAWSQNMIVAGDYAVWADNGEICNQSAADVQPKFLERISARDERPKRYRMRTAAGMPGSR
ncbi:hypothetical protein D3C72_535070 [compost metagenome]